MNNVDTINRSNINDLYVTRIKSCTNQLFPFKSILILIIYPNIYKNMSMSCKHSYYFYMPVFIFLNTGIIISPVVTRPKSIEYKLAVDNLVD